VPAPTGFGIIAPAPAYPPYTSPVRPPVLQPPLPPLARSVLPPMTPRTPTQAFQFDTSAPARMPAPFPMPAPAPMGANTRAPTPTGWRRYPRQACSPPSCPSSAPPRPDRNSIGSSTRARKSSRQRKGVEARAKGRDLGMCRTSQCAARYLIRSS
jgi:hypothetical protein